MWAVVRSDGHNYVSSTSRTLNRDVDGHFLLHLIMTHYINLFHLNAYWRLDKLFLFREPSFRTEHFAMVYQGVICFF